jgi:hypothetical protein
MGIEKRPLEEKKQRPVVGNAANKVAKPTEPPELGAEKKLAIARLVNAKLSTAKLTTLRKLGS